MSFILRKPQVCVQGKSVSRSVFWVSIAVQKISQIYMCKTVTIWLYSWILWAWGSDRAQWRWFVFAPHCSGPLQERVEWLGCHKLLGGKTPVAGEPTSQVNFSRNVSGSLAGIVLTQSFSSTAIARTSHFSHGDLLVDRVTSPPRFKESVSGTKISLLNERSTKEFIIVLCLNGHRVWWELRLQKQAEVNLRRLWMLCLGVGTHFLNVKDNYLGDFF